MCVFVYECVFEYLSQTAEGTMSPENDEDLQHHLTPQEHKTGDYIKARLKVQISESRVK